MEKGKYNLVRGSIYGTYAIIKFDPQDLSKAQVECEHTYIDSLVEKWIHSQLQLGIGEEDLISYLLDMMIFCDIILGRRIIRENIDKLLYCEDVKENL